MNPITRFEDRTEEGLAVRYVFGLNILAANGVAVSRAADPRLIFLRALARRTRSSAHAGSLALEDMVDDPAELFGPPSGPNVYVRTLVGLHGGRFYDLAGGPTMPACVFSQVTDAFWDARTASGGGENDDVRYLLDCDALALYVGVTADAGAALSVLLADAPFPGQEGWLQATASLYPLVCLSGADGWFLKLYTADPEHFGLLAAPLAAAVGAVENSSWYRENSPDLVWDGEWEGCLMRPERLRA